MRQLMTKWGSNLNTKQVLTEYPRPDLVRGGYRNLNGYWDYAFTKSADRPGRYDGRICVPFSPESVLSGVERQLKPSDYLHYRRVITIKDEELNGRLILHFGAVDQSCRVYINGSMVGGHVGGYLPFSFDITELVHPGENEISLAVRDVTDASYHSRGKQKLDNGGIFYTAQSGIWQTVWMESVPDYYITDLKITPCCENSSVKVKVFTNKNIPLFGEIEVLDGGRVIASGDLVTGRTRELKLPFFEYWTPEHPKLYDLRIHIKEDEVTSYFAMRSVWVGEDDRGILRFFLNGKPYFHNGLLDQGYWPDGLMTPPSDEAMEADIKSMKELGFNMLRKHVKIEPARWYYHCDRLGMLVWQDMVNGGSAYHMKFVSVLPNTMPEAGRMLKDGVYKAFARESEEGRNQYYRELKGMIRNLWNHPSIVAWVPFNEGWGQFDAAKASAMVREIDPGRLIDEASGWFDQGGGDMYSIHNYWRKLKVEPKDRVVALTEYGGYALRIDKHSYANRTYGYRKYQTKEELTAAYVRLMDEQILPAIRNGLSAAVYTQLSDVEEEVNGLLTYDREMVKIDADAVRECNRRIYKKFEECL